MTHVTSTTSDISDLDLAGVESRVWDVVVIGAGPAGATTAFHLAQAGFDVLLVDKHRFPRDKVCGDGLIPDALTALNAMGLADVVRTAGHAVQKVSIYSPSRIRIEVNAECVTLKRRAFDRLLVDAAVEQGATLGVGEVCGIEEDEDGVRVSFRGSRARARARVGVVATGADISLLEGLGLVQRRQPSAIAVRCYVTSPVAIDDLVVSFDRSITPGYAWIFPLGSSEYNVGCGFFYGAGKRHKINLRTAFHNFTRRMPLARDLMATASRVTPLQGAMLRSGLSGSSCQRGEGIVCIGETIGATYPFTGEGIGKAMETGALAAELLADDLRRGVPHSIHELPARIREHLAPRYRGYHVAQRWLSRPWLNDLLAWRIARSQSLRDAAAGVLNETVDPRAIFSWRTFLPGGARRAIRARVR
jgi:geranylgeranyl reductase family protein